MPYHVCDHLVDIIQKRLKIMLHGSLKEINCHHFVKQYCCAISDKIPLWLMRHLGLTGEAFTGCCITKLHTRHDYYPMVLEGTYQYMLTSLR
jgi:hypothetical protein